ETDPVLEAAGARLRGSVNPTPPSAVEAAVLRRRSRRLSVTTVAALVVSGLLAGALVIQTRSDDDPAPGGAGVRSAAGDPKDAQALPASRDPQPVDPTTVQLVSTVSTFPDCDALIGDLRRVGAEHVGSRGFGGFGDFGGGGALTPGLLDYGSGRYSEGADDSAFAPTA